MQFQSLKKSGGWSLWIETLMAITLLFSACAGSGSVQSGHQTTSTEPKKVTTVSVLRPNILTVGSYMHYPPQEYLDVATDQPSGFDIDLITAIAQQMGLHSHIVAGDFPLLIDNLAAGQFDVVISAVSITPEVQKKAAFIPYFKGGESLLVAKGNPQHIQTLSDLCGENVGVEGTTFEQSDLEAANTACQSAGKAMIQIHIVNNQSEVMQLMISKQIVATYQDAPVTDYCLKTYPGRFEQAGAVMDINLEGIAVRKDDQSMLTAIQQALKVIQANGTYHRLIVKWGLTSGDITTKK